MDNFGMPNGITRMLAVFLLVPPYCATAQVVQWGNFLSEPASATNLTSIAGGGGGIYANFGLALRGNGTVVSLGGTAPAIPASATNVVAIAAGQSHGLALRADGSMVGWGGVGLGEASPPTNQNHIAIAAGNAFSLAVRSNKTVTAWGSASFGITTVPSAASNVLAVAAGYAHALALRNDGTVVGWGDNSKGQTTIPANATNLIQVAAGGYHSLGLLPDGKVIAWGDTNYGLTSVAAGLSNVVAIASGYYQDMALRADGTVFTWGFNNGGLTNTPAGLTNTIAIAAGYSSSLAVTGLAAPFIGQQPISRTVDAGSSVTFLAGAGGRPKLRYQWQWNGTNLSDGGRISGANTAGLSLFAVQTNDLGNYSLIVSNDFGYAVSSNAVLTVRSSPTIQTQPVGVTNLSAGLSFTFSVTAVGAVPLAYQWFFNGTNLPGATNTTFKISNAQAANIGDYYVIITNSYGAVTSQVTTLIVASSPPVITSQPQSRGVAIRQSITNSASVRGTEPLSYQWFKDGAAILDATNRTLPIFNFQTTDAGTYYSVITNAVGTNTSQNAVLVVTPIWGWGGPGVGETVAPVNATNVLAIAAGRQLSVALRSDGTVVAWGLNSSGQTNVPPGLSNVVAVTAGDSHVLALKTDGTVMAWGYNIFGQTNVPSGLSNVVAVAAGGDMSGALRSDGTVVEWGWNANNETNVPAGLNDAVGLVIGDLDFSLALRANGSVVGWGVNQYGDTNPPAGLTNAVGVAAGFDFGVAARPDGTAVEWGNPGLGLPAGATNLTSIVALAARQYYCLALHADGSVVGWGANPNGQTNIPGGLSNVVAIATGPSHALALVGNAPRATQALAVNPVNAGSSFSLQLQTQCGRVYWLECKNDLSDPSWLTLPLVAGNGGIQTLTDNAASGQSRFYRVRAW